MAISAKHLLKIHKVVTELNIITWINQRISISMGMNECSFLNSVIQLYTEGYTYKMIDKSAYELYYQGEMVAVLYFINFMLYKFKIPNKGVFQESTNFIMDKEYKYYPISVDGYTIRIKNESGWSVYSVTKAIVSQPFYNPQIPEFNSEIKDKLAKMKESCIKYNNFIQYRNDQDEPSKERIRLEREINNFRDDRLNELRNISINAGPYGLSLLKALAPYSQNINQALSNYRLELDRCAKLIEEGYIVQRRFGDGWELNQDKKSTERVYTGSHKSYEYEHEYTDENGRVSSTVYWSPEPFTPHGHGHRTFRTNAEPREIDNYTKVDVPEYVLAKSLVGGLQSAFLSANKIQKSLVTDICKACTPQSIFNAIPILRGMDWKGLYISKSKVWDVSDELKRLV